MGSVPPLLWYLLAVVALAVFPLTMIFAIHRHHMKVLALLRFYAEKGTEPPPAIAELLMKQLSHADEKWKRTKRGALLQTFGANLFIACIMAGVSWWRLDVGEPRWAIYWAVCSAIFFAVFALGALLAALTTSDK
jgi:hypothetical protein